MILIFINGYLKVLTWEVIMKKFFNLFLMFSLILTTLNLKTNAEVSKTYLDTKDKELIKEEVNTVKFTVDPFSKEDDSNEYTIEIKGNDELHFKDVHFNDDAIVSKFVLEADVLKLEGFKEEEVLEFELSIYVNDTNKTEVALDVLEIKFGKVVNNESWSFSLSDRVNKIDSNPVIQPRIEYETNLDFDKLDYYIEDAGPMVIEIMGYNGELPENPIFPSTLDFMKRYEDTRWDFEENGTYISIEEGAFKDTGIIGTLTLPNDYTEVGDHAFSENSITELVAPELRNVGKNSFSNNIIETLYVPSLKSVSSEAFMNNRISGKLQLENLTTISGPRAFMNNNIEELELNSVNSIPVGTFRNNELKNVSLEKVGSISSNSFLENKIENLYAPNVTDVGSNAFRGNNLTNISLDEALNISASAFSNNEIKQISAPKLQKIGKFAFSNNLLEKVVAPNLKDIDEYALRLNNLKGIELNALPEVFYDNSFNSNDTSDILGFFAFYIDGFEENHIIDGYRIVVNPNERFLDELLTDLGEDLTYITSLPKDDDKRGFSTGIDKEDDYYYCVSMYTLFTPGVFKGYEITDSVYIIKHGNSGNTQHDVDLPVQKQLVSIDERPDEFSYSYTGELMSKLIYHLEKMLFENVYENQYEFKPAHFIHVISSNLELGNKVSLSSQNVLPLIEDTTLFKQLEEEYGRDFLDTLFTNIKEDTRSYTNSYYYHYVPEHGMNYEEDSQPLLKPGIPINTKIDITVDKVWIGGPSDYPEIEVGLYRNDELIETVKLNDDSWSYTWEDLPETNEFGVKYEYRVDEIDVPEGYEKVVDGTTIINTYEPEEPPVNTPEEPPVNTPEEPPVNTPEEPPVNIPNLPSTGSFNISLVGLFMVVIGLSVWIFKKE